ncbi:MAG: hypothetical protein KGY99_02745 [Phycisphaerae bacterium]|nr:hypothetical protein [Phycisphaerae bacterium]
MREQKIVARFRDGRLVKGTTTNFAPGGDAFLLRPYDGGDPERVNMEDLKAVFFVRDYMGDRGRKDKDYFVDGLPYQGRRVEIHFTDGEVLLGYTPNYNPQMPGFFVFPADPDCNTLKVYAVASAVKEVRLL